MTKDPPKPQPNKFRDLARELECDEDEARFAETVWKVAKAKAIGAVRPADGLVVVRIVDVGLSSVSWT